MKRTIIKLALVGLMVWVSMTTLSWANQGETESDFTELSIEDLMNLEVTTVSKKAQKLSDTAAAVFVITQSDIQRSGATSIPEALRMAPGVEVARIDASKWAVTVRGFNGRFANKLLVLMDGRTLYTPTFSGVFWHMQDTLLEDIDRIEVIRGPGASLWGANAVNGVINIITKKAGDSQGSYLSAGGGTEERVFAAGRYGGHLDNNLSYRMYAKYFDRDNAVDAAGDDTADHWDGLCGGFRMDWEATAHDTMTLQGDIFDGEDGETLTTASLDPPYSITSDEENGYFGGNLLGRWMHRFSNTSETVLQLYYDGLERTSEILDVYQNTFDIDFQHRFQLGTRHRAGRGFSTPGLVAASTQLLISGNGPEPQRREPGYHFGRCGRGISAKQGFRSVDDGSFAQPRTRYLVSVCRQPADPAGGRLHHPGCAVSLEALKMVGIGRRRAKPA